jgi:hypothetical protein
MGAFAAPLMIASTAISAMGALQQGKAQQASYNAQAGANEYNAVVAQNNAKIAADQANAQEEQQRRHYRELQGKAMAGVAQSGTGFDGSNADMLAQSDVNNELDALTIRYEGINKVKSLESQAQIEKYNAAVNRSNGSAAMQAAKINAGAQVLSGATNFAMYREGYGMYGRGR